MDSTSNEDEDGSDESSSSDSENDDVENTASANTVQEIWVRIYECGGIFSRITRL